MPLELAANIGPSIPHLFAKEGIALWNREAPLASACMKEEGVSNAVYWSVSNSGAGGTTNNLYVGEGDAVNTTNEFNVDDITALSLNRAILRNGFSISHTELGQVRSLRGEKAADIVIERLRDAWLNNMAATARFMELQLLIGEGSATSNSTGNAVQGLVGLFQVFFGTSYAGKTLAGYSGLQPTVTNGGGAALTTTLLDTLIATLQSNAGSFKPNFIMCNPKTATYVKAIGDNYVRSNADGPQGRFPYNLGLADMPTADTPIVQYNGIPVMQNSAWSSPTYDGYLVVGDMQDLALDILPYENWEDTISEESKDAVEGFGGLLRKVGIPMFTWPYAKTASTVSFMQEVELQFKIKRPNRLGLLYNVT